MYIYVCSDTIGSFIDEYLVNPCHRLGFESSCYFNNLNTNDSIEISIKRKNNCLTTEVNRHYFVLLLIL